MKLSQRINSFANLGRFLGQFGLENPLEEKSIPNNGIYFKRMLGQLESAEIHNGWFTKEYLRYSCESWAKALSKDSINQWASNYEISSKDPKTVALIMAGNIPLVGFHDFLSVLLTGNRALVKLASGDSQILPILSEYLISLEPEIDDYISFTDEKLVNFDAVIATGSNNSARYFDYYFGKYPNIIRKNRNSVAVLTGKESIEDLEALANDIFLYFGLGCRNVSKLYIPEGYEFDSFFSAMYTWKEIIQNNKYMNNYDYNKAVY